MRDINKIVLASFWKKVESRLNKNIKKLGDNECWPWIASINQEGYGQTSFLGKNAKAHRVVMICKDRIDFTEKQVLHSCDNRICCNPKHLRWGTNKENCIERIQRNESERKRLKEQGIRRRKITKEQLIEMKKMFLSGTPKKRIAKYFNVSPQTISYIIKKDFHSNDDNT